MPCSLILGPLSERRTCCSAANTESKQSGRMTLCAASVFVSCNSVLDCVWVLFSQTEAESVAGALGSRRSAWGGSDVGRIPVELGCGFGRCGAPAVLESGGDVNRSSLSQRVLAPEGDGARGADCLGRRPALANPRGTSRTPSLRGPDGIKGVSWVNRHVSGKSPGCAGACSRGGETARRRSPALVEPLARCPQRGVKPLGRGARRPRA